MDLQNKFALRKIYNNFQDWNPLEEDDFINAFTTLQLYPNLPIPSYVHNKILKRLKKAGTTIESQSINYQRLEKVLLSLYGTFIPYELWGKEANPEKISLLKKFINKN